MEEKLRENLISNLEKSLSKELNRKVRLDNKDQDHINTYRILIEDVDINKKIGYEELIFWDESKNEHMISILQDEIYSDRFIIEKMKDKKPKLDLLNSEGPILTVYKTPDGYVLYDREDSIVEILSEDEFTSFINGSMTLPNPRGGQFVYTSYPEDMKPSSHDLEKFMKNL